jgi:LPS export ABC transporter protein LptC
VKTKKIISLVKMITVSLGTVIVLYSCSGNSSEAKLLYKKKDRPVASGQTRDFEAFYTLKGQVAMRLKAKAMDDYTEPDFPRQIFPGGLFMEIFNHQTGEKTTIQADTAVVYKKTGMVELIGNVVITGDDGSQLKTSQLFWDRMHEHIFTDKEIEFRREDEYIHGTGFDSNMSFTTARVNNVSGIIKIKTKK